MYLQTFTSDYPHFAATITLCKKKNIESNSFKGKMGVVCPAHFVIA